MKTKACFLLCILFMGSNVIAKKKEKREFNKKQLLRELSEGACKCVDSIETSNIPKSEITSNIHRCIDQTTGAYLLGSAIFDIDLEKKNKKKTTININLNNDVNSEEYKTAYFTIERFMMDSCKALKLRVAVNDIKNEKSYSQKEEAQELFTKGVDAFEMQDYKGAAEFYIAALKADSNFAFAWDNLGLCYRKLEEYDKALFAYKKSLQIDPKGTTPLQNMAIVYQYQKKPDKAITAYERMLKLDSNNAEVYYGIGIIYLGEQKYEEALDHLCSAYNLYIKQKSPYRSDAEKAINMIYAGMKKEKMESKFEEILKRHNIKSK